MESVHRNTASMKSPELHGISRFRAGWFQWAHSFTCYTYLPYINRKDRNRRLEGPVAALYVLWATLGNNHALVTLSHV